jgi:hypothetical protein
LGSRGSPFWPFRLVAGTSRKDTREGAGAWAVRWCREERKLWRFYPRY